MIKIKTHAEDMAATLLKNLYIHTYDTTEPKLDYFCWAPSSWRLTVVDGLQVAGDAGGEFWPNDGVF